MFIGQLSLLPSAAKHAVLKQVQTGVHRSTQPPTLCGEARRVEAGTDRCSQVNSASYPLRRKTPCWSRYRQMFTGQLSLLPSAAKHAVLKQVQTGVRWSTQPPTLCGWSRYRQMFM